MKALLFLIGLVLIVAGIATGVVSQVDYGKALIGLNLGLAATLLVGGFVVLGMASIIGAIGRLADELPQSQPSHRNETAPVQHTARQEPSVNDDMPFPAATAAVGATAGAAGLAIGSAFDKASDGVDAAVDKVAEVAKEAKEEAVDVSTSVADAVSETVENVTDKASDLTEGAAEAVGDSIGEAASDAKEAVAETVEDVTDSGKEAVSEVAEEAVEDVTEAQTPDDAGAKTDDEPEASPEADIPEDGDQLYIVEEVEIRGKPARVLSDNTVEAETAEGWMRFENIEHLEEYLDAMEA